MRRNLVIDVEGEEMNLTSVCVERFVALMQLRRQCPIELESLHPYLQSMHSFSFPYLRGDCNIHCGKARFSAKRMIIHVKRIMILVVESLVL